MKRRFLGWHRDPLDRRDHIFRSSVLHEARYLPAAVSLRSSFPPPYDQGDLGSCTANAVGSICDFRYGSDNAFMPARLFLYYMTRLIEHTVLIDNGASIRNTIKAVNRYGICDESFWRYVIVNFNILPPLEARDAAIKHQAIRYQRVNQTLDELRSALADNNPVAFGFSVYESFYDLNSDNYTIKAPAINESPVGGHAVTAVGYDDELQYFVIRNSWGTEWGDKGYFLMPYSFILDANLCSDFWTIELME